MVVLTITTTLHLEGKFTCLLRCLSSICHHHSHEELRQITHWHVINEYCNCQEMCDNYASILATLFPFVQFYQKSASEQGQAKSLNIILTTLVTNSEYWVHFEEGWECTDPFICNVVAKLTQHNYLHQIQLYHATYYTEHTHVNLGDGLDAIHLNQNKIPSDVNPHHWPQYSYCWPLFSLRPSINRVKFLVGRGFDESPEMWPVAFEFVFALAWWRDGGNMATLDQPCVIRQVGHKSTYHYTLEY